MERFFLHILLDEKVVNSFISLMEEAFPDESTYLIIAKDGNPKRVTNRECVVSFDEDSKELKQFLSKISAYKHVCIHSLGGKKFYTYIHHSSISWVIWGVDFYGLLELKGYELYYDKELQYKARAGRKPLWAYKLLTTIRDYRFAQRKEQVIKRLKYVIFDNGCDYGVFKQYYGDRNLTFPGTINYYPIENLIDPSKLDEECNGNAIWVGNSGAPNGNHVWLFEKLAGFSDDIKIISPISYGANDNYLRFLDIEGKRILGNKYFPLKDFMPVNDYYSLFLQANAFVFGHFRQCAVGNILMAFYFGGKVFLSNRNPLLPMYKESGFVVYSIEDDLSEEFAVKPLNDEQRVRNRELVLTIASHKSSIDQLKNVFGKIKVDSENTR